MRRRPRRCSCLRQPEAENDGARSVSPPPEPKRSRALTRSFSTEPLSVIVAYLQSELAHLERVTLEVTDPDLGHGLYSGEAVGEGHRRSIHRPLRVWSDLADRLELRLFTPVPRGDRIVLTFARLDQTATLLNRERRGPGKYAPGSGFERASKLEDPDFLIDLDDALERCDLPAAPRVLSLGVNAGDELVPVLERHPEARFTGVDHDSEALRAARERFRAPHKFIEADLASPPELPPHDLVLCLDTLQVRDVVAEEVLLKIVRSWLAPEGCVILGLPNCRYLDGEQLHGTRLVNFRQPELSQLFKSVAHFRRFFQRQAKRVFVTGKREILVTAIPIRRS